MERIKITEAVGKTIAKIGAVAYFKNGQPVEVVGLRDPCALVVYFTDETKALISISSDEYDDSYLAI